MMAIEQTITTQRLGTDHDLAALYVKLDSLWITYLKLLDQYQRAREDLSKSCALGFLSLAEANFKSPLSGRGRRYGQDYYDERAKASTTATISTCDTEISTPNLSSCITTKIGSNNGIRKATTSSEKSPDMNAVASQTSERRESAPKLREDVAQSDLTTNVDHSSAVGDEATALTANELPEPHPTDPLRWFGVLVPRELRTAQRHFISAVEGPVASATNAARSMRQIETEIRKIRKEVRKSQKAASSALQQ